ncbi:hypothetical protein HK098_001979 [Nowakowskiella sp. JEL0407]|nr:hypothetical protein HK098_001979 [Nowakowskiella sp. JEL0407]
MVIDTEQTSYFNIPSSTEETLKSKLHHQHPTASVYLESIVTPPGSPINAKASLSRRSFDHLGDTALPFGDDRHYESSTHPQLSIPILDFTRKPSCLEDLPDVYPPVNSEFKSPTPRFSSKEEASPVRNMRDGSTMVLLNTSSPTHIQKSIARSAILATSTPSSVRSAKMVENLLQLNRDGVKRARPKGKGHRISSASKNNKREFEQEIKKIEDSGGIITIFA